MDKSFSEESSFKGLGSVDFSGQKYAYKFLENNQNFAASRLYNRRTSKTGILL